MIPDPRLSVVYAALAFNPLGWILGVFFLSTESLGVISFHGETSLGTFVAGIMIVGGYFAVFGAALALVLSIGIRQFWIIVASCSIGGYFVATLSTQHAMEYVRVFVEMPYLKEVVGFIGAVATTLYSFGIYGRFVEP